MKDGIMTTFRSHQFEDLGWTGNPGIEGRSGLFIKHETGRASGDNVNSSNSNTSSKTAAELLELR
jgi:hypothetical protein